MNADTDYVRSVRIEAGHGDLTRDYLDVAGPAGSHRTPSALWHTMKAKR